MTAIPTANVQVTSGSVEDATKLISADGTKAQSFIVTVEIAVSDGGDRDSGAIEDVVLTSSNAPFHAEIVITTSNDETQQTVDLQSTPNEDGKNELVAAEDPISDVKSITITYTLTQMDDTISMAFKVCFHPSGIMTKRSIFIPTTVNYCLTINICTDNEISGKIKVLA